MSSLALESAIPNLPSLFREFAVPYLAQPHVDPSLTFANYLDQNVGIKFSANTANPGSEYTVPVLAGTQANPAVITNYRISYRLYANRQTHSFVFFTNAGNAPADIIVDGVNVLSVNTDYQLEVVSHNSAGLSSTYITSAPVKAQVSGTSTPPSQPTPFNVELKSSSNVLVTWGEPIDKGCDWCTVNYCLI